MRITLDVFIRNYIFIERGFYMNSNFVDDAFFIFQGIYSRSGNIIGVECLTRNPITTDSSEFVFSKYDSKTKIDLFNEQLNFLLENILFFKKNKILATLNVDNDIIEFGINNKVMNLINDTGIIRLEINEFVTIENLKLISNLCIYDKRLLWLDDFFLMNDDFSILEQSCFECIKLDKEFFWWLYKNEKKRMLQKVISKINKKNMFVVVEGVENTNQKKWLSDSRVLGMQGFIWPEVRADLFVLNGQN